MTYISLYRKYRSQTFDEIVGQKPIIVTLKNAVLKDRLSHAYLFAGPRGTGKTSTARIFAKVLNCEEGKKPFNCGKCSQCIKITSGDALNVMEIDAASNRGIDEIRDLRDKIRFKPVEGKYKIYIIDEVHMLTNEAFNALLKTLEEPPDDTIFILATTEAQRVPVTISSRCQRFDFGRIALDEIAAHLEKVAKAEKIDIDPGAVKLIARYSEGAMRDALSLLDQLVSFCQGKITADGVIELLGTAEPEFLFGLGKALASGDSKTAFELVEKGIGSGVSIPQLAKDLIAHFRNLMLVKIGSKDLVDLASQQLSRIETDVKDIPLKQIENIIRTVSMAETDMKWHPNSRIVLEVAFLDILGECIPVGANGRLPVQVKDHPAAQIKSATVPVVARPVKAAPVADEVPVHPDGSIVLEKVSSVWKNILEAVKGKSPFGYVSLCEAEPHSVDVKGRLVLSFNKGYSFHKSRVEEEANKKIIEDMISSQTGSQVKIACIIQNEPVKTAQPGGVQAPERVTAESVAELFDGTIVK